MTKTNRSTRSKATRKSDVNGAIKLVKKLMAEKKPVVPEGFAEAVERSMAGTGINAVNRRVATAFLARPFKEMAKKIRDDVDTAKAFAVAASCIKGSAQKYRDIADLMGTAEVRIQIALCQREDMEEIVSLAEELGTKAAKSRDGGKVVAHG